MKKNNNILFTALSGVLLLGVISCGKFKDFGDTNVNPNGSAEVLTSALITNVEANIAGPGTSLLPGYYCQYYAEPTYPGSSLYNLPQINSTGTYSGSLMDCQVIINKNTDSKTAGLSSVASAGDNNNQIAVATILKSYLFWTVTDRWGDMPYSQALQGSTNLTPKYDAQEDIYKGLFADLKSARAKINPTGAKLKGDIIFDGDMSKWAKFANSLRMLMAIRLSKKVPSPSGYAALEFSSAFSDIRGHITANSENLSVSYPGGNYRNPWFSQGASADNGVAQTYTDALVGLGDSRISAHCSNSTGVPYGLNSAANAATNWARILAPALRTEASTLTIINAAQLWLAKAEALELGWITPNAPTFTSETCYNTGVTASFSQWGVTMSGSYLTTGPANFNSGSGVASIGGVTVPGSSATTASKMDRIALQKWIANYPDAVQGWSDWRRFGVPNLKPTIYAAGVSGNKIVSRYVYGTTEYALNNTQLQTAIGNLPGGDNQNSKVWWNR